MNETIISKKALRYLDLARANYNDLLCLFKCGLSEILFFLVKDGISHKCDNKRERALEGKFKHPPTEIM